MIGLPRLSGLSFSHEANPVRQPPSALGGDIGEGPPVLGIIHVAGVKALFIEQIGPSGGGVVGVKLRQQLGHQAEVNEFAAQAAAER